MIFNFSKEKFLSLPLKRQHKKAAELLKFALIQDQSFLEAYQLVASWMHYKMPTQLEEFQEAYFFHMQSAMIPIPSHIDPFETQTIDPLSAEHYLPITIYLDNLRSAFNVGSILRTMEAFRIKSAYFAKNTPFIDHAKVQETSMGTSFLIHAHRDINLIQKPIIALECLKEAKSIYDFEFPASFTLVLGNESLGVSKEILDQAHAIIKIPLNGAKNSLNVASAFAIAAYEIRKQNLDNSHD